MYLPTGGILTHVCMLIVYLAMFDFFMVYLPVFNFLVVYTCTKIPAVDPPLHVIHVVPDILLVEAGGEGGWHVEAGHLNHTGGAGGRQVLGHPQIRSQSHARVRNHQLAVLGLGINEQVLHHQ